VGVQLARYSKFLYNNFIGFADFFEFFLCNFTVFFSEMADSVWVMGEGKITICFFHLG